ncbi:hypothetical protein C1A40_04185 [Tamlana carrageenivorans]|uniref:Uncharacterized protein n=2 Tax=Pseudotamlana carrageenivorans TaxID=2069432 RepID=A0A2I7SFN1_9FLAO|nr:hypothetical protein C1A40_04185 [Tamlana carrageenivorans]
MGLSAQDKVKPKAVDIPEPLMFDLVRGLGASKGELEINTLADFPMNHIDSRGVEWAPEIEYAVIDGLAFELEFPMHNFELEAIKVAAQYTLGQSKSNKFIHGIQVIGETMLNSRITELSMLYIPAYRFNKTWSAIGLFGVMIEMGADVPSKHHTILLNTSVFANLNEHLVLGLELNNTDTMQQGLDSNEMSLLVLPQMHYHIGHGYELQFGIGANFENSVAQASSVLRFIKTF